MSKKSLEEIIFSSAIYKDAQENFLISGLEGATEEMLNIIGAQLYHGTYAAPAEKRDDTDFYKIFTELVVRQLLVDLKAGLMNNDLDSIDINKLTNGDDK